MPSKLDFKPHSPRYGQFLVWGKYWPKRTALGAFWAMSEALHGHVAELQGKIIFIDTSKGNRSERAASVCDGDHFSAVFKLMLAKKEKAMAQAKQTPGAGSLWPGVHQYGGLGVCLGHSEGRAPHKVGGFGWNRRPMVWPLGAVLGRLLPKMA